jgi:hypothetical protein
MHFCRQQLQHRGSRSRRAGPGAESELAQQLVGVRGRRRERCRGEPEPPSGCRAQRRASLDAPAGLLRRLQHELSHLTIVLVVVHWIR